MHRLLLDTPPHTNGVKAGRASSREANIDINMVIILAALLCALICAIGLNSIIRCVLRFRRRLSSEPSDQETVDHIPTKGIRKSVLHQIPVTVYGSGVKILVASCAICLSEFVLHLYDRPPLVPVTILLLLLVLAFSTRSGYIIDLRRNQRNLPAVATSRMLEFILFGFYWRNRDLMNDAETMVLATTLALFILCFLRAVAPGFGHNLPTIALFAAAGISFQISQVWSHMPYIGAVVVAKRIFQDYDEGLLNNLL